MNRLVAYSARRMAAALVVLAALFHVQWLAACDLMPMPEQRDCCPEQGQAGGMVHCEDEIGARACLLPFAQQAAALKLPERSQDTGDPPDDFQWVPTSYTRAYIAGPGQPLDHLHSRAVADGRSLYLTSSRLRL